MFAAIERSRTHPRRHRRMAVDILQHGLETVAMQPQQTIGDERRHHRPPSSSNARPSGKNSARTRGQSPVCRAAPLAGWKPADAPSERLRDIEPSARRIRTQFVRVVQAVGDDAWADGVDQDDKPVRDVWRQASCRGRWRVLTDIQIRRLSSIVTKFAGGSVTPSTSSAKGVRRPSGPIARPHRRRRDSQ